MVYTLTTTATMTMTTVDVEIQIYACRVHHKTDGMNVFRHHGLIATFVLINLISLYVLPSIIPFLFRFLTKSDATFAWFFHFCCWYDRLLMWFHPDWPNFSIIFFFIGQPFTVCIFRYWIEYTKMVSERSNCFISFGNKANDKQSN